MRTNTKVRQRTERRIEKWKRKNGPKSDPDNCVPNIHRMNERKTMLCVSLIQSKVSYETSKADHKGEPKERKNDEQHIIRQDSRQ